MRALLIAAIFLAACLSHTETAAAAAGFPGLSGSFWDSGECWRSKVKLTSYCTRDLLKSIFKHHPYSEQCCAAVHGADDYCSDLTRTLISHLMIRGRVRQECTASQGAPEISTAPPAAPEGPSAPPSPSAVAPVTSVAAAPAEHGEGVFPDQTGNAPSPRSRKLPYYTSF